MLTRDDSSFEKFVHIHVSLPTLDTEKWDVFFQKNVEYAIAGTELKWTPDEQHYHDMDEIIATIRKILSTPRLVKSFARHLAEKARSPARYVFLPDIFALCAIETTNPRLFLWIAANRDRLQDLHEEANTELERMEQNLSYEEDEQVDIRLERRKFHQYMKQEFAIQSSEYRILEIIFFSSNSRDIGNRVRYSHFFSNFFFRDSLPEILTPIGTTVLRQRLSEQSLSEIAGYLNSQFENQRDDIQVATMSFIEAYIKNAHNADRANLLVAYGICAKGFDSGPWFFVSGKKRAARLVDTFLQENALPEEKQLEFLESIAKQTVSDSFLRRAARHYYEKKGSHELKIMTRVLHERLYPGPEQIQNVFKEEVSDEPIDLLIAWRYLSTHHEPALYLEKLFSEKPDALRKFLEINSAPYSLDTVFDNAHSLKEFIDINKLQTLIRHHRAYLTENSASSLTALIEAILSIESTSEQ